MWRGWCGMVSVAVLFLLLLPQEGSAQGTVTFAQSNVQSAAQAATFTFRLYVTPPGTTTPNPAVVLTGVTCTGSGPAPVTASCTAPLPTAGAGAKVTGAKSQLSAQDGATAESGLSPPFSSGASAPGGLSITP